MDFKSRAINHALLILYEHWHVNTKLFTFVKLHSLVTYLHSLIFLAIKGNNSLHTGAILTNCKMHHCVSVIYIKIKFHRILCICYLVTTESDNFKLIQEHNSCSSADILMKLYVNSHVILIHIQFKFHEVLIMVTYLWLILWNLHQLKLYLIQHLYQSDET